MTDNAIARFDGVGNVLQGSAVTIDDSGNISGIASLVGHTTISGLAIDEGITLESQETEVGTSQSLGMIQATTTDSDVLTNPVAARIGFWSRTAYTGDAAPGQIRFYTNDGVGTGALQLAAMIDSSGDVGVGTSSPAFLHGGGIEIERSGPATLRFQNTAAGTAPRPRMRTSSASGIRAILCSSSTRTAISITTA